MRFLIKHFPWISYRWRPYLTRKYYHDWRSNRWNWLTKCHRAHNLQSQKCQLWKSSNFNHTTHSLCDMYFWIDIMLGSTSPMKYHMFHSFVWTMKSMNIWSGLVHSIIRLHQKWQLWSNSAEYSSRFYRIGFYSEQTISCEKWAKVNDICVKSLATIPFYWHLWRILTFI